MKKERSVLKTYFATNKIPTADNFGELIDSGLNQVEDGIKRDAGNPVSIQAEGQGDGVQDVLYFYKNFNDANPGWRINLNPRTDAKDPATRKSGLNFSDATGISRLFIKSDDGNVGLGTITPGFPLTFGNQLGDKIGLWGQSGNHYGFGIQGSLLQVYTDTANADVAFGWGSSAALNETMRIKGNGNVGIGTAAPKALLDVAGFIPNSKLGSVLGRLEEGNNNGDGTFLGVRGYGTQTNVFNGKGFGIEHSFYGSVNSSINFFRGGNVNGGFLTFNTNNNLEKVRITADGNVGIGTLAPMQKLSVAGDILTSGNLGVGQVNTTNEGSRLTGKGNISIRSVSPQIDFIDTDNNQWAIHVNSNKMYFIREPWNYTDLVLDGAGKVGIGTDNPQAQLHVNGYTNSFYGSYRWLARSGEGENPNNQSLPASIIASHRIVAAEFNANSDARIKKDFLFSNSAADLETLIRLQIKDYRYQDEVEFGTAYKKGFVAQDVEKVFPEAVSSHAEFVPGIFSMAESTSVSEGVLLVSMKDDHLLNTGETIRLITASGSKEVIICRVDNKVFSVKDWNEDVSGVFVYGKKVEDFRSVNYNSIFTLGISAIQELCRQFQQLKEDLSEMQEKLFMTLIPAN